MNLSSNLAHLENSYLVRRLEDADLAYVFKHTLTQETAYDSLVRTRRTNLHRQVAEAIEMLWPDQLEQHAVVLARHYSSAGLHDKAFRYAVLAGDVARRAYALPEALMHYDRALELAERSSDPAVGAARRNLYAHRGNVLEVMGRHAEAIQNYRAMIAFAQRRGDVPMEADGMNLLLTAQGLMGPVPDEESQLEHALGLARQSGDQELVGRALWTIGLSLRFREPARAAEYFNQALELARAVGSRKLAGYALTDLTIAMMFAGQWRQVVKYSQEALEIFRELDNKPMVANSLGMLAEAHYTKGEPERAWAYAEEGKRISEMIENPWGFGYNESEILYLLFDAGEFSQVFPRAGRVLSVARKIGFSLFAGLVLFLIVRTYSELDELEQAETVFEQAQAVMAETQTPMWSMMGAWAISDVYLRRGLLDRARRVSNQIAAGGQAAFNPWVLAMAGPYLAKLALYENQPGEGLELCDRLLAHVQVEEMWNPASELYMVRGEIYMALGELARAEVDFDRARRIAERAVNRVLLWRIDAAYAALFDRQGDRARAVAARRRAADQIRALAAKIDDAGLRESFLRRKDVAEVLAADVTARPRPASHGRATTTGDEQAA